jgi:hypothetical protein
MGNGRAAGQGESIFIGELRAEPLGFLNARPAPAASTCSWLDADGKGR